MRAFWNYLQDPVKFVCLLASVLPVTVVYLFMNMYGRRVPEYDQWERTIYLAIHVKNGTLTLADILAPHNGHRIVFTNLVTVIVASISDWNPRYEMWVNLMLGLLNFALILGLVWRLHRPQFHLLLPVIAVLHFSLAQDANWTNGFQTCWHFVTLFFLLALTLIIRTRAGWLPLFGAALLMLCASFASGSGLVGWIALLGVMWVYGYRRWYYPIAWLVLTGIAAYLYFAESQITIGSTQYTAAGVSYASPDLLARFVLNFLGAPFAFGYQHIALSLGVIGVILLVANVLYLSPRTGLQPLAPWMGFAANAIGSGLVVALGRLEGTGTNMWRAIVPRFIGLSNLFWLALIILGGLMIDTLLRKPERTRQENLLLYGNLAAALIVLQLHILMNTWILQGNILTYQYDIMDKRDPEFYNEENCLLEYPLYHEGDCLRQHPINNRTPETVYVLASYRLAVFSEEIQANVLPETYLPGSPVILHSPSQWHNLYMHEYLLNALPQADVIYVAPPSPLTEPIENFPDPPQHLLPEMDAAAIEEMIAEQAQVWYIHPANMSDASTAFFEQMAASGYIATPYPIQNSHYRLAEYAIWRFQQPPENTATILSFGEENISLEAWSINTETAQPCDNIRLQSWWQSAVVPQFNYSATLVLVAPDGTFIAQKDAAIGDTLMQLWFPDQFYFDERILTVPCDAPPGEYTLTFGMYLNTGSGFEDLPAYDPAGNSLGTRAQITSLIIE